MGHETDIEFARRVGSWRSCLLTRHRIRQAGRICCVKNGNACWQACSCAASSIFTGC